VAWVSYFYAREGPTASRVYKCLLIGIRLTLLALVALMIAELMLSLRRTGLPTVVVAIDESSSMGIVDRVDDKKLSKLIAERLKAAGLEEATRMNLAKSLLLGKNPDLLSGIEKNYKLKVYFIGSAARDQGGNVEQVRKAIHALEPVGESSRLGADLRSMLSDLRGTSPAAMILITDGITTEGESLSEAARFARRKGVPLFTVGIGSEQPVRDLELSDLLVDEVVFVDDVVNFEFKLVGTGLAGRSVDVVLRDKSSPTVLARTKVIVGGDGQPQKLHLPYRPTKVGEFEYVVEVEPLKEEAQADNNRQQRLVSVRKEQIQVLLVQAYPNFEFRYLKNMLDRDTTVRLKTVLQDADLEYAEQDQSALRVFPVKREDLFQYDVLILGDMNPSFLSTSVQKNISDFVETKGGGVAFIAGPKYNPLGYRNTPLAPLIPFDISAASTPDPRQPISEGFKIRPTELGLSSPAMQVGDSLADTIKIWQNLPDMYWLLEAPNLKPAARVLAEHPTRLGSDGRKLPVFLMQYFGAGKVLYHCTDETWRWRYRVGDVLFARYWVQTIRYLSRSKLLGKDRSADLAADRREYHRGEPVRLRARFIDERLAPAEDDGVTVVLERSGHKNQSIKLERNATSRGIFEGVVAGALDGQYHAWIATPTLEGKAPAADFLVLAPPGELEHVQMDAGELKRAADETRGRFYRLADAARLIDDLPPGRQVPIESLPPRVLWNQWWVLATFLGLIVSEWLLRKRRGML
jgi:von Willebrand factor type A domain